uniref:Enoyl reductase (ER) domain-containing protein n=1 Tax=Bionectria ochroleuca TaxID=29856 RepID=A0A8H7NE53_BIOOC
MTAKNRQWTTKQDGLDNLELGETAIPEPKDGEVLVKIKAVSLNYRDTEVCQGEYTHHSSLDNGQPLVPCSDMAGEIVASKSPRWQKTGARVLSIFNQTHLTVLAQYRVFPDYALVPIPEYLSDEEACTLPIAAVTAWTSINGFRPLGQYLDVTTQTKDEKKPPPVLLAQGTGGVSVAALQIAHAAGLATIVTSSSDDKLDRARKELSADTGINYRTHWEWHDFACVAFGGTIACIGYLSGKDDDEGDGGLNRLNVNVLALRRNVTLKGILNGPRDRFEEMLGFYEKKGIRPVVDKVFKFEEAKEAFKYLAEGAHFGKVVIKVAD